MTNIKIALITAGFISASTVPLTVSAAEVYAGVDVVGVNTEIGDRSLGIGVGANFNTSHLRIKAGYHILDYFALEAYVMTPGDDTTESTLTSSSGGTSTTTTVEDKFDTGVIIGANIKLVKKFERVDLYGLIGISRMDTELVYTTFPIFSPSTTTTFSDSVILYGAGAGLAFNIRSNMKLNFEAMYQTGTADYDLPGTTSTTADIDSIGISAGVSYYF